MRLLFYGDAMPDGEKNSEPRKRINKLEGAGQVADLWGRRMSKTNLAPGRLWAEAGSSGWS